MTTQRTPSESEQLRLSDAYSQKVSVLKAIFVGHGEEICVQTSTGAPGMVANAERPEIQHFDLASLDLDEPSEFEDIDDLVTEFSASSDGAANIVAGRRFVAEKFYGEEVTITTLRLRAGLSQKQLGEICGGLEQPHISRYESGKTEPMMTLAIQMASALGVTVEELGVAWRNARRIYDERNANA